MKLRNKPVVWMLLSVAGIAPAVHGQKKVTHQSQYWIRYYGKYNLTDKWTLNLEVEDRRFFKENRQAVWFQPRLSVERKLGAGWTVGAGFTYYTATSPADPTAPEVLTVPELRPHQYLNSGQKVGYLVISHRFQVEERWTRKSAGDHLEKGYHFKGRVRYRFQLQYPLLKRKAGIGLLALKLSDEVLLNVGHDVVVNSFDQNRVYLALYYGLSKNFQVELGYMSWFQERSSGQYYNRDIGRLTIYHSLNFSNKSN